MNFIVRSFVFPFDVMVFVDESDEQILKKLTLTDHDKNELLNLPETCLGRCVMLESNITIIRLKTLEDKYTFMGVISHEIFHAVTFIMLKIGVKFEMFISDEVYSYLIQFYTEDIFRRIFTPKL